MIGISPSFSVLPLMLFCFFCVTSCWRRIKNSKRDKSSSGKVTNVTPVSMLEVKVTLPTVVIFGDETMAERYDPAGLSQLPKLRLGEGTLGTLFKVVLDCGSIIAMRMVREGLVVGADNLESWIKFFGGIRCTWLLPMHFSFWYGGEAFILYDYLCLGSLEDLLHGSEGMQFSPLSWKERKHIALAAAKAVAFLHAQVAKNGEALVCGVIKSSNILIRLDCSACLSSYETPYVVSPETLVRRNVGRVAPELTTSTRNTATSRLVFTQKSDVYGFGILLIELMTGQRPTMTDLREYIIEKRKQEGIKGIFDKRLGEVKASMVELIGIARLCLARNPLERPPMDRVVEMIQDLQD